jgi:hypothetical protein
MRRTPTPALALVAVLAAVTTASAAAPPRPNWEEGWHVVRPGDTLEALAARLLGSSQHWRELAGLNPEILNPNFIRPGQRIRIWIARPSAEPNAQVETVAGKVDERPQPVPWRPAGRGDLLLERDGLRTFERGSTRLRFEDGSSVTLTENSLVFIRRQEAPRDPPSTRREIEIEVGQADVEAPATAGRAPEIDIVLGDARGRATASSGPLHARSSAERGGSSRLMIYRGSGEVAAAGERVELPEGTGTSVEPKQPPKPAESLLAAPELATPADGAPLGLDHPVLAWHALEGAAAYTVEVCADRDCGELVERARVADGLRYRLTETPPGPRYWRVTATSASGLDGYPAPARSFTPVESLGPPTPTLSLLDAAGTEVAAGACLAAAPRAEIVALDRYGAPLASALVVAGRELAAGGRTFGSSGPWRVAALARDAAGRTATSAERGFVLDLAAPAIELPSSPAGNERSFWSVARRSLTSLCAAGLEVSLGGDARAIPCADAAGGEPLVLPLGGDRARLLLRADASVRIGDRLLRRPGERVELPITEIGCGLAAVRLEIVPDPARGGAAALAVTVTDRAGRETRRVWALEAL